MDFKRTLLALLAIFCVVVSAGAVCAADGDTYDDGWAGSQYDESTEGGYAGSQYDVNEEGGYAGSQYNESAEGLTDRPLIDPDYAHTEAAGEPTNETGNATNSTDNVTSMTPDEVTSEAAGNSTNSTAAHHTMPATGNPITILIGVAALAGGYTILKRKD